MLADARRRRLDVVVCWSLDRMGRSLKHLVVLLDDLQALGVSFVSVREGLDWTTPSGRLQAQLLSMIAEFERARIVERVRAGMARARSQGKHLGRPRRQVTDAVLTAVAHLSARKAAAALGVSKSFVAKWRLSTRGIR
jgi:DNA invertase Pin-like site-specific DNA recombinase